jgi:hypothetical protein
MESKEIKVDAEKKIRLEVFLFFFDFYNWLSEKRPEYAMSELSSKRKQYREDIIGLLGENNDDDLYVGYDDYNLIQEILILNPTLDVKLPFFDLIDISFSTGYLFEIGTVDIRVDIFRKIPWWAHAANYDKKKIEAPGIFQSILSLTIKHQRIKENKSDIEKLYNQIDKQIQELIFQMVRHFLGISTTRTLL